VAVPDWIWLVFLLAFGCCVGSFLNVVIYRLPRDESLIRPPSSCPACGKRIRFYDNIPLISWLLLGAKCRYCKTSISPRYFVIELLTGSVFLGVFFIYFRTDLVPSIRSLSQGGWFVYLVHVGFLGCLIAASAIDLELWVIPLSICWVATGVGVAGSGTGPCVIEPASIRQNLILPSTSDIFLKEATVASLAVGALVGLAVSLILLAAGVLKRSYEASEAAESAGGTGPESSRFNDRSEILKEVLFLLPIILCAGVAYMVSRRSAGIQSLDLSAHPVIAGLLGSIWGYFVGCGIVWITRILGTLGFGREAMGLGDVHLMGAAGAVIGSAFVAVAFFVAPFLGLAWAVSQMFFKKTRQIPYGPFLSLGVFAVMILHDWILGYWNLFRYHY
jgi:leader peptidase (prepilin peptidase)/N-methyltransferase